jgi:hypothetical protein
MNSVIPATFSFRFALPLQRVDALPRKGKQLLKLTDDCRLFWPGSDLKEDSSPLKLSAAWNSKGFGIAAEVSGKQHPAVSNIDRPDETDSLATPRRSIERTGFAITSACCPTAEVTTASNRSSGNFPSPAQLKTHRSFNLTRSRFGQNAQPMATRSKHGCQPNASTVLTRPSHRNSPSMQCCETQNWAIIA